MEKPKDNPIWYGAEDSHVSLIAENTDKVIKLEADLLNDCVWQSSIEIPTTAGNNNLSSEHHQNVSDNTLHLNNEDINYKDKFCCNICKKDFAFGFYLKNHMAEHSKQTCVIDPSLDYKRVMDTPLDQKHVMDTSLDQTRLMDTSLDQTCVTDTPLDQTKLIYTPLDQKRLINPPLFKCNFCEKEFKLNFSCNRHVQKYHSYEKNTISSHNMYESNAKSDYTLNLRISKFNGIWKSKPNFIHKCMICFEKFDSENILVEHLNLQHDENQRQCQNSLEINSTSIDKNSFKCQKCNITFAKQDNLNCHLLHCTNSSRNLWNTFFSNAKNNEINSHVCTVCGVSFSHLLLLKSHMSSDCKSNSNPIDSENHNDSIVHNVSNILSVSDFSKNMKNDNILPTTVSKKNISMCSNTQNVSSVQNLPQNLEVNNYSIINVKKEKNVCTTLTKNNTSGIMDIENSCDSIAHNISENSEMTNYILNIKKEKNVCTTLTDFPENSSDSCLDAEHINDSPFTSLPHNFIVKKEPGSLSNDNIERTIKYFSIKKLPNKNVSVIATNINCEQKSQPDFVEVFVCNICEMSSSTDRDSFALHMSSHPECGIHECVVCNEIFNSVKQWKDHMTYHQKLINLHLSELLQSRTESRVRKLSANSLIEPRELSSTPRNGEIEFKNSFQNSTKKKLPIKKTKHRFSCNICSKILPSELTLMAHRTLHSEPQLFSCKFCNQTFTSKELCTNHEKVHNQLDTTDEKLEPKSHNVDVEKSEDNFAFCSICNKQFGHNGALTNHMRIHYNCNHKCSQCGKKFRTKHDLLLHQKNHLDTTLDDTNIVNNEEQQDPNDISQFTNSSFNNKQNCVKSVKKTNMFYVCDVCEKKFSNAAQLIVHRNIHDNKPYLCKICGRFYAYKFRWNTHLKSHHLKRKNINSKINQFKCGYCKKEYNIKSQWKRHLSLSKECRNHNYTKSSEGYECNICHKSYSTFYNRKVHLINVHKQFNTPAHQEPKANANIKNKTIEVKTNKLHQCKLCFKNYYNSANLKRHQKCIHSNENINCNICGKVYKHKYSYQLHIKYSKEHKALEKAKNAKQRLISNPENISSQYIEIDEVQSTSNNQNETAEHLVNDLIQNSSESSNSCDLPAKCKICFKVLKSHSYLPAHMRLHSGVKPFRCIYCNVCFRFKSNLRSHCKKLHPINKISTMK